MKKLSILSLAVILCSMISCVKDKNEPNAPKFVEAVDLGLSVKWATFNVGATAPEGYGDYFAWGEVEPYYSSQDPLTWKEDKTNGYAWQSYCGSSSFTEWSTAPYDATTNILKPEFDAATANWGSDWRMPTKVEYKELIDNCTWTWTKQNNVNGYKIVGPNGNSIFLPAAGYYNDMYGLYMSDSYGAYWSSSLKTLDASNMCSLTGAYNILFYSSNVVWRGANRCCGLPVRPVCQ